MTTMTAELIQTNETASIAQGKQAKACWKAYLAEGNKPTAAQMAIYTILRGKSMAKTFTPITNSNKLANGHYRWAGRNMALAQASLLESTDWAPFASMLVDVSAKDHSWKRGTKQYIAKDNAFLTGLLEQIKQAIREA